MSPRCRYCAGYHDSKEKCAPNTASIYALVDPRDQAIRYVGRTLTDLGKRLSDHLWDRDFDSNGSGKQRLLWLTELKRLGLQPEIRLLEIVDIRDIGAEMRWMIKLTIEGAQLTNAQFIPSKAYFMKEVRKGLEQKAAGEPVQPFVMREYPWDVASDEVQFATLNQALVDEEGNVTRAAEIIGISRGHINRLLVKFKLAPVAQELRIKAGAVRGRDGRISGRPRKPSH